MHSSRGRLRTMCGLRTGGWSLPGVMSDWKRCVDWLLAKYCRCRLRLDWCWCRWRTSAKGRRPWGLQVWRRQVGLVRGTRWPVESSGRFLGWASKSRSSRDYVGAESWVAIGRGYTEFAGFAVVHQKTTGLLGWATKPRPKTRRGGAATQAGLTAQEGRPDRLAGLTAQGGQSDRPGCRCRDASKQRTRVGIARLA
jgi:hypothetical protein